MTYGKRDANGVVRLSGSGSLTGGTGNYKDIKGSFTLRGGSSTKTSRDPSWVRWRLSYLVATNSVLSVL